MSRFYKINGRPTHEVSLHEFWVNLDSVTYINANTYEIIFYNGDSLFTDEAGMDIVLRETKGGI
jgi:hypothetical protein